MVTPPLLIDATMLLRWRDLAPVGIVRLERLLAGHLRLHSNLGTAEYVVWDSGYRPADDHETASLDDLLRGIRRPTPRTATSSALPTGPPPPKKRAVAALRRTGLRALGRVPSHLRPLAENAAWSLATLGVESSRHAQRALRDRKVVRPWPESGAIRHRVDFSAGADLVALGLGWEYLDHEAMYRLKTEHGVRIHMPAFDLIPVLMPQMNAGQSHLVHRYYAEMAHYADSITSISYATRDALADFFAVEDLPIPHLAVNQLPGIDTGESSPAVDESQLDDNAPRHRFAGDQFVLSVSTIEIRKNHVLLAKIWTECISEGLEMPKLVLVGRFGWDIQELQRWVDSAPELDGNVVICADVEDDELVALYRDALFTVLPSRIEGWGLPITESLDYGKVCIHSTDPAQFEASQGLMPARHPDDFLGWKAEILKVYGDDEYRHGLEQRITNEYVRRTPADYCSDFEAILAERRGMGGVE